MDRSRPRFSDRGLKCILLRPQTVLPIQLLARGSLRDGPSSHSFRLTQKSRPSQRPQDRRYHLDQPSPVPPSEAVSGSPVAVCRHRLLIKLPSAMPSRRGRPDSECADSSSDADVVISDLFISHRGAHFGAQTRITYRNPPKARLHRLYKCSSTRSPSMTRWSGPTC